MSNHDRRSRSRSNPGAGYSTRFRADVPTPFTAAPQVSTVAQILSVVDRATSANLREPNLALNLQIADLVNEKKGSAPREVAMYLAKRINSWSMQVALLSLSVLDVCVKNCGYPFHLAISRRDFLNLLVKRFPERPPLRYTRVQILILEMIEEWTATLAKASRYRDDLGHIRDMHRLLSCKGYMFPEADPSELAALAPDSDALKSAAELEREDREAQSAKLQELIRSGTPQDLKEANRLMSIMSGFRDPSVDYKARMAAEVDKVRRKADILREMQQAAPSDRSEVKSELTAELKSALPKLKRILADEQQSEDANEESVAKVQEVIKYVESVANGEPTDAIDASSGSGSSAPAKSSDLLIDIFDSAVSNANNNASSNANGNATTSKSAVSDLLGLDSLTLDENPEVLNSVSLPVTSPEASQSVSPNITGAALSGTLSSGVSSGASSGLDFDPFSSPAPVAAAAAAPAAAQNSVSVYNASELVVNCTVSKKPAETELLFTISNPSTKKVTNLTMQYAPPRSLTIEVHPASGSELDNNVVTQKVVLRGTAKPKLRWNVQFNSGITPLTATGDLTNL